MEQFKSFESTSHTPIEAPESIESIAEIYDIIQSLDEEVLRKLLARELNLAGVEAEDRMHRFFPFEEILVTPNTSDGALGEHSIDGVTIFSTNIDAGAEGVTDFIRADIPEITALELYPDNKDAATDEGVTSGSEPFARILDAQTLIRIFKTMLVSHVIVHEELHAISTVTTESTVEESLGRETYTREFRSGVQKNVYLGTYEKKRLGYKKTFGGSAKFYIGINEGITELITRRLSRELLSKTLPDSVLSNDINVLYDNLEMNVYKAERHVTEQLVALFSVIAEVPLEVVERGLFRSYLNGGDFIPEELVAAVRHDVPELAKEHIEELLLKLQITISEDSFADNAEVNRIFDEFVNILPQHKKDQVKNKFNTLLRKYNFRKELQDDVVEK